MAFKMKGFPLRSKSVRTENGNNESTTTEKEWEWTHMLPSERSKWNHDFDTWSGQTWFEMLPSEKEKFNYDFDTWLNTPSSKKEKL